MATPTGPQLSGNSSELPHGRILHNRRQAPRDAGRVSKLQEVTVSDLSALLEKVKAAKGADEALDLDIARACAPNVICMRHNNEANTNEPFTYWKYTGSIDAALALVERCLPGWHGALTWMPAWGENDALHCCEIGPMAWTGDEPPDNVIGQAATPALAILAALLTALIAKQEE